MDLIRRIMTIAGAVLALIGLILTLFANGNCSKVFTLESSNEEGQVDKIEVQFGIWQACFQGAENGEYSSFCNPLDASIAPIRLIASRVFFVADFIVMTSVLILFMLLFLTDVCIYDGFYDILSLSNMALSTANFFILLAAYSFQV